MEIGQYSINDNSKCPCGSGKKFVGCCKWKKHEYSKLGKDYKGRNIILDETEQKEVILKLGSAYMGLKNIMLEEDNALEILESLYKDKDAETKKIKKYIPCSKGCSKCCYMYIDCSPVEASLIRKYIETYFTEEQVKDLKIKIEKNLKYVPTYKQIADCKTVKEVELIVNKYRDLNIPCVFLNKDGECTIYEVRPLQCRAHFIISDPAICREENIASRVSLKTISSFISMTDALSISVDKFDKFIVNDKNKMNDLEYLKGFTDNKERFSIVQSLFHWFADI